MLKPNKINHFERYLPSGDTRQVGFTRTGIEIGGRVRVGWFGGHIPTLFYFGHLYGRESGIHQKQIRVWRLAVSVRIER